MDESKNKMKRYEIQYRTVYKKTIQICPDSSNEPVENVYKFAHIVHQNTKYGHGISESQEGGAAMQYAGNSALLACLQVLP
jgi:hypothetical protein